MLDEDGRVAMRGSDPQVPFRFIVDCERTQFGAGRLHQAVDDELRQGGGGLEPREASRERVRGGDDGLGPAGRLAEGWRHQRRSHQGAQLVENWRSPIRVGLTGNTRTQSLACASRAGLR